MKKEITIQVHAHQNKNLLLPAAHNYFKFTKAIRRLIRQLARQDYSVQYENELLDHAVSEALSSFYELNQYYNFDSRAQAVLREIYQQLLSEIKAQNPDSITYSLLAKKHYKRLQQWLVKSYPAAVLLYPANTPFLIQPVVCAEYKPQTQMQVLGINKATLKEPILDIGCGKEYHLVHYLRQQGLDAYGIDREILPSTFLYKNNWLEFSYTPNHWGTIISHLGFSNHFWHQYLLQGSMHLQYAATYMRILHSLKKEGCFYYAPGLPFVETFLDSTQFHSNSKLVEGTSYKAITIIKSR